MILGTWASHALGFAGEVLARVVVEPLAEVVVRRFEPAPGASLGCEFCESMSEDNTRLAMQVRELESAREACVGLGTRVRELEAEVVHLRLDEAHTQQVACTFALERDEARGRAEALERERDEARARADALERERDAAVREAEAVRRDFVLKHDGWLQHMRELSDRIETRTRERDVARDRVAELERRLRQRGGNVLAAFPTEPPLRVVEDEDP